MHAASCSSPGQSNTSAVPAASSDHFISMLSRASGASSAITRARSANPRIWRKLPGASACTITIPNGASSDSRIWEPNLSRVSRRNRESFSVGSRNQASSIMVPRDIGRSELQVFRAPRPPVNYPLGPYGNFRGYVSLPIPNSGDRVSWATSRYIKWMSRRGDRKCRATVLFRLYCDLCRILLGRC